MKLTNKEVFKKYYNGDLTQGEAIEMLDPEESKKDLMAIFCWSDEVLGYWGIEV